MCWYLDQDEEITSILPFWDKLLVSLENKCTLHWIFHWLSSSHATFLNSSEQVDFSLSNTKQKKTKSHFSTQLLPAPLGLSGLVRSEGTRRETDSRVKDIKRKVRGREIGFPFFSIPIVGHGPCRLNSYANRQLKVRRDNTKPTWLPDTYLSGDTVFSMASCYSLDLKVACLSAFSWTVILSSVWNTQAKKNKFSLQLMA